LAPMTSTDPNADDRRESFERARDRYLHVHNQLESLMSVTLERPLSEAEGGEANRLIEQQAQLLDLWCREARQG
jgi:hypothetical protein